MSSNEISIEMESREAGTHREAADSCTGAVLVKSSRNEPKEQEPASANRNLVLQISAQYLER